MKQLKHWQDPVNAVLGVGVVLSPWVLGFQDMTLAMANAVVIGLALIAAALGAIFVPRAWEEWTEAILGLWLVVSPWALGFNTHYQATMNALVIGAVIVALALWTLMTDEDYRARWHKGTAH